MKFKWDKKYLYWGATAFLVIAASVLFYSLLNRGAMFVSAFNTIIRALSPFIYGVLIAYLLGKVAGILEKGVFRKLCRRLCRQETKARKISRILAITVSMLLALGLISGALSLILPELYKSVENLITMVPVYAKNIITWAEKLLAGMPGLEEFTVNIVDSITDSILSWAKNDLLPQANSLVTKLSTGVFSVLKGILNVLIGFVISVYIMYHKETFSAQLKKMLYGLFTPARANGIMQEYAFIKKAFGDFVAGKIIDSIIIGFICYVCLNILQMPYAALVSLIIGVTNVIPVFGPFIGAVPSALLILLESPLKCLIFVIFIIILQQIDGNIIGPKILGNSTGLSGFWIMFAILFFGGLFGIAGMLFGVPLMAVIYNAVKRFNEKRLRRKNLPVATTEFRKIRYIDAESNEPVYYRGSGGPSEEKKEENSGDAVPPDTGEEADTQTEPPAVSGPEEQETENKQE